MFSLKGGKGRGRASATRRPGLPHSFLVSRPEGESSGDLLSRQLRRVIGKGDSREREGCPSPRASKAAGEGGRARPFYFRFKKLGPARTRRSLAVRPSEAELSRPPTIYGAKILSRLRSSILARCFFPLFSSEDEDLSLGVKKREAAVAASKRDRQTERRSTEAAAIVAAAACNYKSPMFYGQSSTNGPEREGETGWRATTEGGGGGIHLHCKVASLGRRMDSWWVDSDSDSHHG